MSWPPQPPLYRLKPCPPPSRPALTLPRRYIAVQSITVAAGAAVTWYVIHYLHWPEWVLFIGYFTSFYEASRFAHWLHRRARRKARNG
jgi:hypothetical protein